MPAIGPKYFVPAKMSLLLFSFLFFGSNSAPNASEFHPLILVPGDGGSQLWAKLDRPSVKHVWCSSQTDSYYRLWFNAKLMISFISDCTLDNLRLKYNNETKKTENIDGVDIKVAGFGNTKSVEWLDSELDRAGEYFAPVVEALVAKGMKRSISIRAAPYDFRKAPNELDDYFNDFKKLVETTYAINGNKTILLVGHSMGALISTYFLNIVSEEWKKKYIKAFVSLSGPYGGTMKALKTLLSGDDFGIYGLNKLKAREFLRSTPSTHFLMPLQSLWNSSKTIVRTPNANYTVADYDKLFLDAGHQHGYEILKETQNALLNLSPPKVDTYCYHGVNVATVERISYSENFPDTQPSVEYGNGDGTVNMASLELCRFWQDIQNENLVYKTLSGVSHSNIVYNDEVMRLISFLITKSNS